MTNRYPTYLESIDAAALLRDYPLAASFDASIARLSAAAERACGNDPHARDLQRRMQYRACYDSALSRAVDKVGSRELQALHTMGDTHNVG